MATIEFDRISKRFGGLTVVRDFSLHVADQELLTLVGPSGCGKSTTLNMLAGLEDPSQGLIRIDDRVVNDVPSGKRDIAMVFQSYALYPHMTVRENIGFGLKVRGMPASEIGQRVDEAARILGISQLLDRRPRELSGGQRQRVALGRALTRNPKAFLLDEPLSNLDARLRVETRREIRRLQQRLGLSAVFVTHDQEEALAIADRVAVLSEGKLEEIATPVELYERPQSRFAADFIGHTNVLRGEVSLDDAGRPRFVSAGGLCALLEPSEARRGPAELALRSARCHLSSTPPAAQADGFVVAGVVEQVDYLGASSHYVVQVGGERLLVEEINLNGPTWHAGDQVQVSSEASAFTWIRSGAAAERATV